LPATPSERFVVDTNIFREIVLGNAAVVNNWKKIELPVYLSSVVVEEVTAGLMANVSRARSGKFPVTLARAHQDLVDMLTAFTHLSVLVYSEEAEREFINLPAEVKRVGSQDCRIAAQAVAHRLTVVTRNLKDFQRIGVACVDWTVSEP
jgi:tRNA(fMet)-specific endonuclease VapC